MHNHNYVHTYCLVKFVTPDVMACWENIAYGVLDYDTSFVNAMRRKHQNDIN